MSAPQNLSIINVRFQVSYPDKKKIEEMQKEQEEGKYPDAPETSKKIMEELEGTGVSPSMNPIQIGNPMPSIQTIEEGFITVKEVKALRFAVLVENKTQIWLNWPNMQSLWIMNDPGIYEQIKAIQTIP